MILNCLIGKYGDLSPFIRDVLYWKKMIVVRVKKLTVNMMTKLKAFELSNVEQESKLIVKDRKLWNFKVMELVL